MKYTEGKSNVGFNARVSLQAGINSYSKSF